MRATSPRACSVSSSDTRGRIADVVVTSAMRSLLGVNVPYFFGSYAHDLAPNPRFPDWPCDFDAMRVSGPLLEARAVNAFKWVLSSDFDQYPFTPADEASMNKLLGVG